MIEIPEITDWTFYSSQEPGLRTYGAWGKDHPLISGKSIALNRPLMKKYGINYGDILEVKSEAHEELNGSYIIMDCGVGRDDTVDGFVSKTAMIPSYGRARDITAYWKKKKVKGD